MLVGGCTTAPVARVERDVRQIARPQIATDVVWRRLPAQDGAAAARVAKLVAEPLTPSAAVEIALMMNPDAQIAFEQVGIARADYLRAALPPNFVGEFSVRDLRDGPGTQREFGLVTDLLALLQLPARRRSSGMDFEAAQLDAAQSLIALAVGTRQAYLRSAAASNIAALRAQQREVGQLISELGQRYYDAGNVTRGERELHRAFAVDAASRVVESELEQEHIRQDLLRLLGVTGTHDTLSLAEQLPTMPDAERPLVELEARALSTRLDVRAARQRVEARLSELRRTRWFRFFPHIEAGVSTEREPDGERVTGPDGSVELPLFNAGQALVAEGDSKARVALREAEALALDARKEVRLAAATVTAARRKVELWRDAGVVAAEALTQGAQLEYNFMIDGPFQPLYARHAELAARVHLVEAVRDYWIARLELDRAVGAMAAWPVPATTSGQEEQQP
jgi:cobalt-zinc-cadmium efflux system outer membrane protein